MWLALFDGCVCTSPRVWVSCVMQTARMEAYLMCFRSELMLREQNRHSFCVSAVVWEYLQMTVICYPRKRSVKWRQLVSTSFSSSPFLIFVIFIRDALHTSAVNAKTILSVIRCVETRKRLSDFSTSWYSSAFLVYHINYRDDTLSSDEHGKFAYSGYTSACALYVVKNDLSSLRLSLDMYTNLFIGLLCCCFSHMMIVFKTTTKLNNCNRISAWLNKFRHRITKSLCTITRSLQVDHRSQLSRACIMIKTNT